MALTLVQSVFAGVGATERGSFTALLTTGNDYVDVGEWFVQHLKTKHIAVSAATNNLKCKILASLDGGTTYPITAVSEFVVTAAAAPTSNTITTFYTHLKLQVAPNVAATHGTLSSQVAGASF